MYRFNRTWDVGYRYDRLWGDANVPFATAFDPDRHSVELTWRNSEFSLFRLQLSHDQPNAGDTDNVVTAAVPDQPRRPRRAQVLTSLLRSTSHEDSIADSRSFAPRAARSRCPPQAKLKVFACEPEWGALAQELGGDKVDVYVATTALQDPHHVEAKPSLIARARDADLRGLHRRGARNRLAAAADPPVGQRQDPAGAAGYFEAASQVRDAGNADARSTAPTATCTRDGNPHIQTDPRNMLRGREGAGARLVAARSGQRGDLPGAPADFEQALARGDRRSGRTRRRR